MPKWLYVMLAVLVGLSAVAWALAFITFPGHSTTSLATPAPSPPPPEMVATDKAGPKPATLGDKVLCVDWYLKRTLNDYDGAEYVEWSPLAKATRKGEPYWTVTLRLRAKNTYGGKILKDVKFFIQNNRVVDQSGL